MVTTICIVRQSERRAIARVSTASPQQEGDVHYEGDLDLFPYRYARLSNDSLRQVARTIARQGGVETCVEDSGIYDWWAE